MWDFACIEFRIQLREFIRWKSGFCLNCFCSFVYIRNCGKVYDLRQLNWSMRLTHIRVVVCQKKTRFVDSMSSIFHFIDIQKGNHFFSLHYFSINFEIFHIVLSLSSFSLKILNISLRKIRKNSIRPIFSHFFIYNLFFSSIAIIYWIENCHCGSAISVVLSIFGWLSNWNGKCRKKCAQKSIGRNKITRPNELSALVLTEFECSHQLECSFGTYLWLFVNHNCKFERHCELIS